jgi:hypothetical protein
MEHDMKQLMAGAAALLLTASFAVAQTPGTGMSGTGASNSTSTSKPSGTTSSNSTTSGRSSAGQGSAHEISKTPG